MFSSLASSLSASHPVAALLAATSSQSSGGGSFLFLLLIAVVVFMFFFMGRNQRKQRQRVADLQSQLVPGQQVMTGSGIYGTIVDTADDRVQLEIAPGVVITAAKQAVVRTVEPTTVTDPAPVLTDNDSRQTTVAE